MTRIWVRVASMAVGCLLLGLGIAWFLFVAWLRTPASHTIEAIEYLATSGAVSLVLGGVALALASRYLPRIAAKIGIVFVVGSISAVLIVLYTPLLMFSAPADRNILVITLAYFATVSLAFAFAISAVTTRQLRAVHEGAVRLAEGDFSTRVAVQGTDEAADVARAFNRMSMELGAAFERERELERGRRDLIAAVSHDLRTPLTSIRAMTEALSDEIVTDPETVRRYLGLIHQESEHLGSLIEDLFELSRIESGSLELRLTSVPLSELVRETIDGLMIHAEEKGIALRATCDPTVPPLALDGPRIQRVLVNLIQNAVRHTPAGGQVSVDLRRQNGHVMLAVEDNGEGIAPEDQPHVFQQFYRGEKSRARGSGGNGLGLAIARGIVEAHRGRIHVESTLGRGSRFVVTL